MRVRCVRACGGGEVGGGLRACVGVHGHARARACILCACVCEAVTAQPKLESCNLQAPHVSRMDALCTTRNQWARPWGECVWAGV